MTRSLTLIAALLVASCAPKEKTATVVVDENGGFEATLPDGTVASDLEEYEAAIAGQIEPIEEMQPIALTVTTKAADGGASGITIGKFRLRLAADGSYLEGCVRKKFYHLKIVIETAETQIPLVELHLVAFFENTAPCFAVMNTGMVGYGWCQKYCYTAPKDSTKNGLKEGLKAAGITATTAAIMAALLAPIATTALAPAAAF